MGGVMVKSGNVWLIRLDTLHENSASWSFMYIRKVPELQRPIFWIVTSGTPFICIVVAPPARRLWELTRSAWMLKRSNCSARVAARSAFVIVHGRKTCFVPVSSKYVPRMWDPKLECCWTCLYCQISAQTGHAAIFGLLCGKESCVTCSDFLPDFWFWMISVAWVHLSKSTFAGKLGSNLVLLFQNMTSW